MANSFYFNSSGLNYAIGHFLVFEDNIVIVSPWLSDIEINLPMTDGSGSSNTRLSDIINQNKHKIVSVIVSNDRHNDYIISKLDKSIKIVRIGNLHAKVIVSDRTVYMGSANITLSGTTKNAEICQLSKNDLGSSRKFVEERLGIRF